MLHCPQAIYMKNEVIKRSGMKDGMWKMEEYLYMKDWLETIDDYLKMTRRDILTATGRISHKQAISKAHSEYEKFKRLQDNDLSPVEQHFLENLDILENIEVRLKD